MTRLHASGVTPRSSRPPNPVQGRAAGLTLVEILVVLAILAVLATTALVRLGAARATADNDTARATANGLAAAVSSYYLAYGCYPREVPVGTLPAGFGSFVGGQWPVSFDYEQTAQAIGIAWRPEGVLRWTVWVTQGVTVPVCP